VTQSIRMRAVAFQEGDAWVIQGIEYDIVAHAFDVKKLADAFSRAVTENIVITQHLGKKPLEHFSIRLGVSRVCEISFAFSFGNPFEKRGDCSPKLLNSTRLHFA
jgi:hypothetical protein